MIILQTVTELVIMIRFTWNSGSAILINGVRQTRILTNGLYINSDEVGREGFGYYSKSCYNNTRYITKAAYNFT
jgi:hypothetical protein